MTVFLTGATGFIGRHVASRARAEAPGQVRYLSRGPDQFAGMERVAGDLREPSSYASALTGADIVVHLAGVTGKEHPSDYAAVNVDGTRALVAACRDAGVRKFVFVSSIAASYLDKTVYPYARSKEAAEHLVQDSGLNYLIVRPTLVFGPQSPIWHALSGLARLPVLPVFGTGRARVQPVYVDDVATLLLSTLKMGTLPDRRVDLGGPDVVTFEHLLKKIRKALTGRDSPAVHVPIGAIIATLAWIERRGLSGLPASAGQFSAFVNDSVAAPDPWVADGLPRMMSLDDMLRVLTANG